LDGVVDLQAEDPQCGVGDGDRTSDRGRGHETRLEARLMDMKGEIVRLLYEEGITMEAFPSLFETVFNVCMKAIEWHQKNESWNSSTNESAQ
jgi:hypothetical protein